MNTLLIDPWARTIEPYDFPENGSHRDIYTAIGYDDFNAVRMAGGHVAWCHGEALIKSADGEDMRFWLLRNEGRWPIGGRALVTGMTRAGDHVACHPDFGTFLSFIVLWCPAELRCLRLRRVEDTVDHPVFGRVSQTSIVPEFNLPPERWV